MIKLFLYISFKLTRYTASRACTCTFIRFILFHCYKRRPQKFLFRFISVKGYFKLSGKNYTESRAESEIVFVNMVKKTSQFYTIFSIEHSSLYDLLYV